MSTPTHGSLASRSCRHALASTIPAVSALPARWSQHWQRWKRRQQAPLRPAARATAPAAALCPLPPPCRPAVSVFLYALLTVLFTLAGLAYIIIPKSVRSQPACIRYGATGTQLTIASLQTADAACLPLMHPPNPHARRLTLKWVFGYHTGKPAVFLWQWIGSALLFLFPAITYTLQARAVAAAAAAGCGWAPVLPMAVPLFARCAPCQPLLLPLASACAATACHLPLGALPGTT